MTLAQLRQSLVEQSGHRGLVTDAPNGDYSDKSGLITNATYYINAGLRWLNLRWPPKGMYRMTQVAVEAGDRSFSLPYAESVHRMDLIDPDHETMPPIRQLTLNAFRDFYSSDVVSPTTGRPLHWTAMPPNAMELFRVNALKNGSFDYNISPWEAIVGSLEWRSGKMQMETAAGNCRARYTFTDAVDLTGYTFDFDYSDKSDPDYGFVFIINSGGIQIALSVLADPPWDIDALVLATNDAGTYPAYTLADLQGFAAAADSVEISFVKVLGASGVTVLVDNVSLYPRAQTDDNIWFMPPADRSYTINVFGTFKTSDLSADGDTNWWTEHRPELVIRAARIQLEMDGHRNVSGMQAFQQQVEEEVSRLAAEQQFSFISGLRPEDMVPNG